MRLQNFQCNVLDSTHNEQLITPPFPTLWDSHQHHIEKRAVFVGCGVRAVGTKEVPVRVGGGGEE